MAFFDDINDKISKISQGAIQKTKDMSDSMKITNAIREEENQQKLIYQKIGELYYHDFKDVAEGEFLQWCQEITASKNKIIEWKDKLQSIKGVAICPNCNAEVPANSVFCNNCGAKIPQVSIKTEEPKIMSGKVCKNCGMPIPKGHLFCTNCGTKVEEDTLQEGEPEDVIEEVEENDLERYTVDLEKNDEGEICNQCGALVPKGNLFCTNCGAKQQKSVVDPEMIEIKVPSQERVCPNCGAEMDDDQIFCTQCGAEYKAGDHEEYSGKNVKKRVCPNCGKTIKEGQRFCTGCGTKL